MPDHIRYDLLTQQALRGVVRQVLADAAKKGLPGDHHFYISFDTQAEGVRLSDRLRAQYPEEMTVILQHQFWDLTVTEQGFEVGMSFGGIPEKLAVPFAAISGFFDPSVQFGLQFEEVTESEAASKPPAPKQHGTKKEPAKTKPTAVAAAEKADKKPCLPAVAPAAASAPTLLPQMPAPSTEPTDPKPDKPSGGGEVVRLDRFRKK
jgi:hypothetical protein